MSDASDLQGIIGILNAIYALEHTHDTYALPELYSNTIDGFELLKSGLEDIETIFGSLSDLTTALNNESQARSDDDDSIQTTLDIISARIDHLLYPPLGDTDSLNGKRKYPYEFNEMFSTDDIDGLAQKFSFFTNALSEKLSDFSASSGTGLTIDKSNPAYPVITLNRPFWSSVQSKPSTFPPDTHTHGQSDISGLSATLSAKENTSSKDIANGYAGLDAGAKIPISLLPAYELAMQITSTITTRNALTPTGNLPVFVKDASGDATVTAGGALYLYEFTTTTWIKLAEYESLDIVQDWTNITSKPSVFPPDISTLLTSLSLVTGGTISATDSILGAFGKLQNQITALLLVTSAEKTLWNNNISALGNKSGTDATFDLSANRTFSLTLTGNYTVSSFTNAVAGNVYVLIITQNGSGGNTLTLTGAKIPSGEAIDATASKKSIVTMLYDGADFLVSVKKGF